MTNHSFYARLPLKGVLLALFFSGIVGCGPSLGSVSGKVTFHGDPVKGGSLTFSPVGGGPSGGAEIKPDGTYVAHTNGANGVLVGKCRILYTPPQPVLTEEQHKSGTYEPPPSPYLKLSPRESQAEVKSGSNTIDLDLVPPDEVGVPAKKK